jgi:hypothetical protein
MINNIKNNKLKGWEFMKCGRQEGDIGVDHLGVCPAYPESMCNSGWYFL